MYKVATAAILIQTRGVQSVFSLEKSISTHESNIEFVLKGSLAEPVPSVATFGGERPNLYESGAIADRVYSAKS